MRDGELERMVVALRDAPGGPAYLKVAEALVARGRHADAAQVLERGLAVAVIPGAHELLARVWIDVGRAEESLALVDVLEAVPAGRVRDLIELKRIRVLALERTGRIDEARKRALELLMRDGRDPFPKAVLVRLATPRPAGSLRGSDPFLTLSRAEQFAEVGRPDRAVRIYRRVLLSHPEVPGLQERITDLEKAPIRPRSVPAAAPSPGTGLGSMANNFLPAAKTVPLKSSWASPAGATGGPSGFEEEEEVTLVEERPHLAEVIRPKGPPPRAS